MISIPYIPPHQIARIKQIDLLSYLQQAEPDELKQIGHNYFTKTHDSLCISPSGIWHWQSRHIGGTTALKYLIEVRGMSFYDAARHLLDKGIAPAPLSAQSSQQEKKQLELLPPHTDNDTVITYLKGRGVHPAVIEHCINSHTLYEGIENGCHNAVFVGYDTHGIPRYGFIRGCREKRYARDATGSDKSYSFCIPSVEKSNIILKTEAAIDALSLATLAYYENPRTWKGRHYLSGGGAANAPLERYLSEHPEIDTIIFCNDADDRGREMTARQMRLFAERGYIVTDKPPPHGKDYNDCLRLMIQRSRAKRPAFSHEMAK